MNIYIKDEDVQEVFEILCEIPFENAAMQDIDPPMQRHPAIEFMIRQLQERIISEELSYLGIENDTEKEV